LFDRLQSRGYQQNKIDENIDCEIFGVLKDEVEQSYAPERIIELQSNEVDDMQTNMDLVAAKLKQLVADKAQNK
jgi:adenylate kinase